MEMIIRGSELQDFLDCRKAWYYRWVLQIEPKKPNGKLFFGTLFHKWLEEYYKTGCSDLHADMMTSVWFNEQDLSAMEQTEIDDVKRLFKGVRDNYLRTYGANDSKFTVLGTEIEFMVKLDDQFFYTGTIDLVYEINGKVRFMDHKTVTSLDMYEEKSKMDRQISRYWWALKMLSAGIGRVKKVIDGKEMWVAWDEIKGKDITGFDYNLIAKSYPTPPEVLKKGGLSKNKAQRTTYEMYLAKIHELGLPESDYTDILEMLKNKQDLFLRRVNVIRTEHELEAAIWDFYHTSKDMHDVRLCMMEQPQVKEHITYRNIGQKCQGMCSYTNLCKTCIEGGNVELMLKNEYKQVEGK